MNEHKVYVVLKIAEIDEGKGDYLFHKIFETMKLAELYVMSQEGICGEPQYLRNVYVENDNLKSYSYSGYIINECIVQKELLTEYEKVKLKDKITNLKNKISELEKILTRN